MTMQLPEELLKAYDAAVENPVEDTLQDLWRILPVAQQKFKLSENSGDDDRTTRMQLVDMWLHSSMLVMEYDDAYYTSPSEIDAICDLLNDDSFIKQVVAKELNARVLALMMLTAVANEKSNNGRKANDGVLHILSAWTGQPLVNDENLTVEKVADLLYGPLVYTLYRTDVLNDESLAPYLCRENLRIVAGATCAERCPPYVTFEIPDNLISEVQP